MTFDFTTEMILSHLLPSITINKKSDCKDHQIYSKILCKVLISVSSESQKIHHLVSINILYTDIYGPNLSKNSLVRISCCPLRTSPRYYWNFIVRDMKYFIFVNVSML